MLCKVFLGSSFVEGVSVDGSFKVHVARHLPTWKDKPIVVAFVCVSPSVSK